MRDTKYPNPTIKLQNLTVFVKQELQDSGGEEPVYNSDVGSQMLNLLNLK